MELRKENKTIGEFTESGLIISEKKYKYLEGIYKKTRTVIGRVSEVTKDSIVEKIGPIEKKKDRAYFNRVWAEKIKIDGGGFVAV